MAADSVRPVRPTFRPGSFTTPVPSTPGYVLFSPLRFWAKVRPSRLAEEPMGEYCALPVRRFFTKAQSPAA